MRSALPGVVDNVAEADNTSKRSSTKVNIVVHAKSGGYLRRFVTLSSVIKGSEIPHWQAGS